MSEELGIRAQSLDEGGPALWSEFMSNFGKRILECRRAAGSSVGARLQAAYEAVVAKRKKSSARRV